MEDAEMFAYQLGQQDYVNGVLLDEVRFTDRKLQDIRDTGWENAEFDEFFGEELKTLQ